MVKRLKNPGKLVADFIRTESASGVVMIISAVMALIFANSPWSGIYEQVIKTPLSFGIGDSVATHAFKDWVKDILMVFFFLVVGLELKREMLEGVLSKKGQVMLPLAAAAGGMLIPAIIYLAMNFRHGANLSGWAIPSATDIAFALCVLNLVGRSVPQAAKVFLLAVAIFDDLGAILIITIAYNANLSLIPLLLSLLGAGFLLLLNLKNIRHLTPYFLAGIYLWFCFYHAGLHTTLAGVLVGMAIPMRDKSQNHHSPLNRCMHMLHPWVSFLVLPVFALTSAGVNFAGMSVGDILNPLPLGIILGLFIGKQIGIFGSVWLLVKTRLAQRPEGASWMHIYGVSVIAGIGFTMSLFIGLLAFHEESAQNLVKIGVISGSLLSAIWGWMVFRIAHLKSCQVVRF